MATIALGTLGGVVGGAIGGPIGAIAGRALGALAGSWVDQQIVAALTPPVRREGPRLTTQDIQGSSETTVIGRHYGRARLTGNVFWATRFLEEVTEEISGGKGSNPEPRTITTSYQYFANFAVGLCEGPVAGIGRIWADGEEIEPDAYTIRRYLGDESQLADPLIEAKEGGVAPAYRGLAYLVFERLPVAAWGNRLPQISAEVFRPTGTLEPKVRGVALIAGNEFGFDTQLVQQTGSAGGVAENRHTLLAGTDFLASLDRLQMLCPNLSSVMLVVPWFGTDLRCGVCEIKPMVDTAGKSTAPYEWQVSGLTRDTASVVSYVDGAASAGGTPSDASVIRAIAELNARGLDVTLCPFIMMDIPSGNTLPNPYSDGAATLGQPVYPWRGRVTVSPAAGFAGSVDQTAAAAAQVATFVGTAAAAHFSAAGATISYAGPDEWTYRRLILHYASLAEHAGGVEAFMIGTEMVALSRARLDAANSPFVAALKTIAADVSGMLPSAKLGYAADWTEWNNHRPDDGSGDVLFHLDPLWSDPAIDFIGIDNYLPLSDWRDGLDHLDLSPSGPGSGPTTIYDPDYLGGNVRGGEHFDWTYASDADRAAQLRTPIADADPVNEPWIYRQKDFLDWWQNAHHDRPGGVRSGVATGWVPGSKPIRFTELGCPAVDKGANQPNVFPDMKSSEGAYPYFSNRARDDAMQRAWLEAMLSHFEDVSNNPGMVDLDHCNLWCWDARPWPDFPLNDSWGDADNWHSGHWLSGRLGAAPAAGTIGAILADAGFAQVLIEPIPAVVDAVTVGGIVSARSLLEALRPAYQFDAVESDGVLKFLAREGRLPVTTVTADDLVLPEGGRTFLETRAQETELPDAIKLGFGDPARDDQTASVEARRSAGNAARVLEQRPPVILAEDRARAIAERELHAAWHGRERASFALPPSFLALDPGDAIGFAPTDRTLRIETIGEGLARSIEAFQHDPALSAPVPLPRSAGRRPAQTVLLDPELLLIDGAMLRDGDNETAGYIAGVMAPFRSGMAAWRSPTTSGYVLDSLLAVPATIGESTAAFYAGPTGRWDRVNALYLDLRRGILASAAEELVLNGANTLAIENADGEWEYLQFATATPNGARSCVLTNLLRGQRGTEHAMRAPLAAGARLVLVNGAVRPSGLAAEQIGLALNWKAGAANKDIGSPDLIAFSHSHRGLGRRPLSPVHLRGTRNSGSGDWTIGWRRRTRLGGDSWDQDEVPLGETSEAYRLRILSGEGGAVLRSFDTTSASQLYSAAQQTADFGAPSYAFWAEVAQLSPSFGPGIFHTQQIWVH